MSNCIELHNHTVEFSKEEFDIEAYAKVVEEHKDHPRTPAVVDDLFCWFLRQNSVIKDSILTIRFGQGSSGHTWRDFRQTVWFLNKFILKPKVHEFQVSDEYDGFDSIFPIIVKWPYASWESLCEAL